MMPDAVRSSLGAVSDLPSQGLGPMIVLQLALGWLVISLAISMLARRTRQRCLPLALVSGVPILGWLTYFWGPVLGLAALLAGVLAMGRLLRRGPRTQSRAAQPH